MAEIMHVVSKFGKHVEDLTMAEGGQIELKICPICVFNILTKFHNFIFSIPWDINVLAAKGKLSGFTC